MPFDQAETYSGEESLDNQSTQGLFIKIPLTGQFLEKEYPNDFQILNSGEIQRLQIGIIKFINLVKEEKTDTIFFLDKSGRPAGYLFKKIWEQIFLHQKLPEIRFINIPTNEDDDTANLVATRKELTQRYGDFAGKRLLIADEYVEKSETIKAAKQLFRNVFTRARTIASTDTGIFSAPPSWRGQESLIGVSDMKNEEFPSRYLAIPLAHKMMNINQDSRETYKMSKNLRSELSNLGVIISKSVGKI